MKIEKLFMNAFEMSHINARLIRARPLDDGHLVMYVSQG